MRGSRRRCRRSLLARADNLWDALDDVSADDASGSPLGTLPPARRNRPPLGLLVGLGASIPVILLIVIVVLAILPSESKTDAKSSAPATNNARSAPAVNRLVKTTASQSAPQLSSPPREPTLATPKDAASGGLPVWGPDSASEEQLGGYVDFGPFQIRMPKTFHKAPPPESLLPRSPLTTRTYWITEPGPNGFGGMIVVSVRNSDPNAARGSPQALCRSVVETTVNANRKAPGVSNWTDMPTETGQIRNLTCARDGCSFTGTRAGHTLQFQSILYVATDGIASAEFTIITGGPAREQLAMIPKAAFLTVRKK